MLLSLCSSDSLDDFRDWWRAEFCAEDSIPESTCDAEAILVVCKVMLQVVLLQVSIV